MSRQVPARSRNQVPVKKQTVKKAGTSSLKLNKPVTVVGCGWRYVIDGDADCVFGRWWNDDTAQDIAP